MFIANTHKNDESLYIVCYFFPVVASWGMYTASFVDLGSGVRLHVPSSTFGLEPAILLAIDY